jgi:hypothetical protein
MTSRTHCSLLPASLKAVECGSVFVTAELGI